MTGTGGGGKRTITHGSKGLETFHFYTDFFSSIRSANSESKPVFNIEFRAEGLHQQVVYIDNVTFQSKHLVFGNPDATGQYTGTDPSALLIERPQYAVSYNGGDKLANWSAWQIDQSWLSNKPADSRPSYRQDRTVGSSVLPGSEFKPLTTGGQTEGLHVGHLSPDADRGRNPKDRTATYLMTNMLPQVAGNNTGAWLALESYTRDILVRKQNKEVYVVAGRHGASLGDTTTKKNDVNVAVPGHLWKAILAVPPGTTPENLKAGNHVLAFGVYMKNKNFKGTGMSWNESHPGEIECMSIEALSSKIGKTLFDQITVGGIRTTNPCSSLTRSGLDLFAQLTEPKAQLPGFGVAADVTYKVVGAKEFGNAEWIDQIKLVDKQGNVLTAGEGDSPHEFVLNIAAATTSDGETITDPQITEVDGTKTVTILFPKLGETTKLPIPGDATSHGELSVQDFKKFEFLRYHVDANEAVADTDRKDNLSTPQPFSVPLADLSISNKGIATPQAEVNGARNIVVSAEGSGNSRDAKIEYVVVNKGTRDIPGKSADAEERLVGRKWTEQLWLGTSEDINDTTAGAWHIKIASDEFEDALAGAQRDNGKKHTFKLNLDAQSALMTSPTDGNAPGTKLVVPDHVVDPKKLKWIVLLDWPLAAIPQTTSESTAPMDHADPGNILETHERSTALNRTANSENIFSVPLNPCDISPLEIRDANGSPLEFNKSKKRCFLPNGGTEAKIGFAPVDHNDQFTELIRIKVKANKDLFVEADPQNSRILSVKGEVFSTQQDQQRRLFNGRFELPVGSKAATVFEDALEQDVDDFDLAGVEASFTKLVFDQAERVTPRNVQRASDGEVARAASVDGEVHLQGVLTLPKKDFGKDAKVTLKGSGEEGGYIRITRDTIELAGADNTPPAQETPQAADDNTQQQPTSPLKGIMLTDSGAILRAGGLEMRPSELVLEYRHSGGDAAQPELRVNGEFETPANGEHFDQRSTNLGS